MNVVTDKEIKWMKRIMGPHREIMSIHKMKGSTSSDIFLCNIKKDNRVVNAVLRLFTNREWLENEPDIADHEAQALQTVSGIDVITPARHQSTNPGLSLVLPD